MLTEILLVVTAVIVYIFIQQKHLYSYFKRHNIKSLPVTPILGNMKNVAMMKLPFSTELRDLYNSPGIENDPFVGIFILWKPILLIRELELVKRVLVKDFNMFSNRVLRADPHHDPLGNNNLFLSRTPTWRDLRNKLSPVFTSAKIKQMYPLMLQVSENLERYVDSQTDGDIVPIKNICHRFTIDMIGTIAFGINAEALKNPDSEFFKYSTGIFKISIRRAMEFFITFFAPELIPVMRVKVFSADTTKFFQKSLAYVIHEREKTGIKRNDLIDTLVAMKQEAEAEPEKSHPANNFDFLVAQAAIFQTAGFETSSSTMSFALYELAMQPKLQERLRTEIEEAYAKDGDTIRYELLQSLPFLDQVITETLRLYPIVPFLERECTPEGGKEGYSLQPYSNFVIPKGMGVYISVLAIQRDAKYWSEPNKFNPDRFAPENAKNINWDAYLPFGLGQRNCIGMRIGLLQTKLGLVHFLRNHRVVECADTPKNIEFDPKCITLVTKGGINLKLERCS